MLSASNAFRTPRVHLVRRSSHSAWRPARNSWTCPPIWESKQDVPWSDGVRFETLTIFGGSLLPFPLAGEIKVSFSRQAQGIAEQGA